MTATAWSPPAGMTPDAVAGWRAFYRSILLNYGITPADYRALYLAQRGRCFICRVAKGIHPDDPKARGGRRLGVDHNHVLGNRREAVRALVCTGGDKTCNRVLGWLKTPEAFERGAQVLTEAPAQAVLNAVEAGLSDSLLTGLLTDDGKGDWR